MSESTPNENKTILGSESNKENLPSKPTSKNDVEIITFQDTENENSSSSSIEIAHRKREELLIQKPFTVQEAINHIGFGRYQIFLLLYTGITTISESVEIMMLAFLMPNLKLYFNLSEFQEGLVGSIVFVGIVVGSFGLGYAADIIGRRWISGSSILLITIAGFCSALSWNYYIFLIARFVVGVAIGADVSSFTLFMECLPIKNRGFWFLIQSTFWALGTILTSLMCWAFDSVDSENGWRYSLLGACIPSIAPILFFPWVPESLRYLSLVGKKDAYVNGLKTLQKWNGKKLPKGVKLVLKDKEQRKGNIFDLVKTKESFWIFFVLCSIMVCGSFCYYGISLFSTDLYVKEDKYWGMFLTSLSEIILFFPMYIAIFFVGRKVLMALQYLFGALVFLIVFIPYYNFWMITISLFIARGLINNATTLYWLVGPECLPTNIRVVGFGLSSSITKIFTVLVPLISTIQLWDYVIPKAFFLILCFLAGVFSFLFPFETKGRELFDLFEEKDVNENVNDK